MAQQKDTATTAPPPKRASLPPTRAFVVQIGADAEPARGTFVGRVAHLTSGATARFATVKQLVDFIRRTMGNT